MKIKKIVLGIILLILVGYIGISYYNSKQVSEDVALRNEIIKEVSSSEEIDFSKIDNFSWDKMYIFTPYSDSRRILAKDNVRNYNDDMSMEYTDAKNIVAFIDNNKVVSYISINREDFDFEPMEGYIISRDEAIFSVNRKEGWITLELR
ncbi:MAG: hypothetical protein ACRCXT_22615 [Paraclostridium sp.]